MLFFDTFGSSLFKAFIEHIQLSLVSLSFAIIIAVPLAIYLLHHRKIAEFIIQIAGVFQTIPSLALLGLLIPVVGIGTIPAIIVLVVYGIFPILQNTYTGLTEIDPSLDEAAIAFGMNAWQRVIKYQIPLALPTIISGIRAAAVMIVGTATLAALIGAGGLGTFILLGIDRNNLTLILIGAISSAILAIFFNTLIKSIEKTKNKKVTYLLPIITFIFLIGSISMPFSFQEKKIIIAGKLGAEPEIIINMYKLLIEAHSDIKVELKPNFGKTTFLYNALKSEKINIYPEFTGTVLETLLINKPKTSNDPEFVYSVAKEEIAKQDGLTYLKPMKYQNTYAIAVPASLAEEHKLTYISDLHKMNNNIRAGFTLEFLDRSDGYKGLQDHYGLDFNTKSFEPKLRYVAIQNGEVNLIDAYSTDSELITYKLKVLEDNYQLFPPYQGAPLLSKETVKKFPELIPVLEMLAERISTTEMSQMNYEVNVNKKSPYATAKKYLEENQLLKKQKIMLKYYR